ncbi:protein FAR1-RELATED SEQUENCE 11-like [Arachis duranensis]|uniref:Protein FAR1-RELATED SEQUENCE 11-like n=1 Tax=Arachis duranensis TaxID=130453 RepID=A0A9C6WG54_ARADU|nr:protein FAR1-RELATED SEQUENCE 11-like [Arachis duranensis]
MSNIFTDTEMEEQYQEDDDINQQEELVCDQDMMDEQNESLAFDFYLKYSKSKGFSARKSKTFKNSIGEVYKQKFVCHRQGFREEKYYTMKKRKKEPRLETRTGCEARMDVKFVPETGRWHIFYFSDKHNHNLLDTQFSAMLPAHRKISEADIMQMMNMLKSEISTSQIFGLLASQADRYEFVGYGPRDMYNEIARQRRQVPGNVARVLKKLEDIRLKDPQLYFKACHDSIEFGLEDKPWVNNIYEEKHMWATLYIREKFQRCVAHLRFKKFNDDYESTRGVSVMQTCIELLERFAAEVYTQEIFLLFQHFLSRVGSTRVLNIENHDNYLKMESFGILCEHIVKVLVDRDICEILWSLVLDRWTKKVKSALNDASGFTRNAVVISRQSALMEFSK